MLDLWIVMAGPAGSGKSSLSESLCASLRRSGARIDLFSEDEIFRRRAFAAVAEAFRTADGPLPAALEAAYTAWVDSLSGRTLTVMDWNPAGMVGDLAWARADPALYRAHLETVGKLTTRPIIVLDLQVTAEVAVRRAARQRGDEWLARYDLVARSAGHHETNRLDGIIAWTRDHIARTTAELEVAASAGWSVHQVDASSSPDAVHHRVQTLIRDQSPDDYQRQATD